MRGVPIDADTVELRYRVGAAGRTIPVPGVFRRQTPAGASVTFNWYAAITTVPQISLNGGPVHSTSWPFDGATCGWRTIAVPVPLTRAPNGLRVTGGHRSATIVTARWPR